MSFEIGFFALYPDTLPNPEYHLIEDIVNVAAFQIVSFLQVNCSNHRTGLYPLISLKSMPQNGQPDLRQKRGVFISLLSRFGFTSIFDCLGLYRLPYRTYP